MTTKEKVIYESIKRIEERLEEIGYILNATPIKDIFDIRMEAQNLLRESGNESVNRYSDYFINKIEELSKKESELFELAEKQKDSLALIDERGRLDGELRYLKRELFRINRDK